MTNDSAFDFEFSVTGGALTNDYGGIGATAGTTVDTGDDSFSGSFTSDFNNLHDGTGAGVGDTVMEVPEPEPQLLVILSVLGLCWVARWRAPLRRG